MENKKHIMTKEWYEEIANSDLAKRYNPKPSWSEHVKLKAMYLNQRDEVRQICKSVKHCDENLKWEQTDSELL